MNFNCYSFSTSPATSTINSPSHYIRLKTWMSRSAYGAVLGQNLFVLFLLSWPLKRLLAFILARTCYMHRIKGNKLLLPCGCCKWFEKKDWEGRERDLPIKNVNAEFCGTFSSASIHHKTINHSAIMLIRLFGATQKI